MDEAELVSAIVWRRLDRPGHESARLGSRQKGWLLEGAAVFHGPAECFLQYEVAVDEGWRTRGARVRGWLGDETVEVVIEVSPAGAWSLNGASAPDVAGCVDVDLNFSPSTNLLPIRRLDLAVGTAAPVRAAWLRFPSFRLEPLDQLYTRLGERSWRYESAGGVFSREIEVDEHGLVTEYPGLWTRERG